MRIIDPPGGKPWALIGLAGASLLLNVVLLVQLASAPDADAPAPVQVAEAPEPVLEETVASVEETVASVEATDAVAPPVAVPDDLHLVAASVEHSLARTFQNSAEPAHADVVAAVYARLFFWDLDLRRDLQKGDQVRVAYTWDGELADVAVAEYQSNKVGTLRAFKFQATGDAFPSWWDDQGREVGRQLENGPLKGHYEQVTSLLKDRPSHKGMDFKTPVGTALYTPRAGTVTRVDWNLRYNGNCIEIRYDDGTLAKFLHLSETGVRAGQRVQAGARIGATGNTGRSTAPHLHYELERSGRVVDPVDYHGVIQRTLPASDRAAFDTERARLESILDTAV